jgi:hypothetical protein
MKVQTELMLHRIIQTSIPDYFDGLTVSIWCPKASGSRSDENLQMGPSRGM